MTEQIQDISDMKPEDVVAALEEGRLRDFAAQKAEPKQLTRADLRSMTAKQINQAERDGRLEDLKQGVRS